MRKTAIHAGLLLGVTLAAMAQAPPQLRYHFGDDPDGRLGWTRADFDDSAWQVSQDGLVPFRSVDADRFLWVRMRVAIPANAIPPLALHVDGLGAQPMSWQVFVNGQAVGGQGAFPPHANPAAHATSPVIGIPSSLSPPGSTAVVVLREWYGPTLGPVVGPSHPLAVIGEEGMVQLGVRADEAEALIGIGPQYAFDALLAVLAILLLFVWRSTRRLEYLWAAIYLLFPFTSGTLHLIANAGHLSFRAQTLLRGVSLAAVNTAEIEFLLTLFQLRWRGFRILYYPSCAALVLALTGETIFLQSQTTLRICEIVVVAFFPLLDCVIFPICVREIFRRNGNRAIALTFAIMEAYVLSIELSGSSGHLTLGSLHLNLNVVADYAVDFAIGAMLMRRAWLSWQEQSALRAEFDAAREVQERLVPAAASLPGFRIESAYRPARDVGGDFFFVRAGNNGPYQDNRDLGGGALIVIGDVSGKGLRAALTVSAVMGALRTMPDLEPARILAALNRGLVGQLGGGFVTCSAITISAAGVAKIANAGHLQPYCGGKEIVLDAGLPLGIIDAADYAETTVKLAATDALTLITDGVLEATNPATGELFGFERTAEISKEPPQQIAERAQAFGQEDDITVLCVQWGAST